MGTPPWQPSEIAVHVALPWRLFSSLRIFHCCFYLASACGKISTRQGTTSSKIRGGGVFSPVSQSTRWGITAELASILNWTTPRGTRSRKPVSYLRQTDSSLSNFLEQL